MFLVDKQKRMIYLHGNLREVKIPEGRTLWFSYCILYHSDCALISNLATIPQTPAAVAAPLRQYFLRLGLTKHRLVSESLATQRITHHYPLQK